MDNCADTAKKIYNIEYNPKFFSPEKLSAKEFSGIQQQCCTFTLSSNILLYSMCGGRRCRRVMETST
jgi:hypothetical protein